LSIDPTLALGGITPEEKIDKVKQHQGTTIMVGDGVNDSAALAAATVGIAVKGSAEASLAAAPVYLAKAGLAPILELMDLSQNTAKIMRINLAVSLAYNLTFAALAFFGYINPLVAAILMPISSLTVVAISMTTGRAIRPSHPENVVINRLATATSTRTQPTNYRGAL
ncbi:MAG: HAD family hydrolase, partial [Planctomycetaceae bacterium]|nr:HAD family hydrolase [Planctomycetaceae bacterium]